jgi:hypothetical protein
MSDPFGTKGSYSFEWDDDGGYFLEIYDDNGAVISSGHYYDEWSFYEVMFWYECYGYFDKEWKLEQSQGTLWNNSLNGDNTLFWELQLLMEMGVFSKKEMEKLGDSGVAIVLTDKQSKFGFLDNKLLYNRGDRNLFYPHDANYNYHYQLCTLAHELGHAYWEHFERANLTIYDEDYGYFTKVAAVKRDNKARYGYFSHFSYEVYPRPVHDYKLGVFIPGDTAAQAWDIYDKAGQPVAP